MMRKIILVCMFYSSMLIYSDNKNSPPPLNSYNQTINITPKPLKTTLKAGQFKLDSNTIFVANSDSLNKVARFFIQKIKSSTGYDLKLANKKSVSNYVSLNISDTIPVNNEGYMLDVSTNGINIFAKTTQGAFYAMQTLLQLLPAQIESLTLVNNIEWKIPNLEIIDEPRFRYRGQHFDPVRHFANTEQIKKYLDVLSMFKINKFHWHLTDDQGWRIEIKKYPKLIQIGGKRIEGDGSTYGPYFYTQDEIKEIVAYAKDRFIEVIPEIELPGHGVAALSAYPQYSCIGGPLEVRNIWGVSNDTYCAGNDSTFQFLADIIEEVIPLFESEYFHIGGDESPKGRWKNCAKCQGRIKELNLKADKDHTAEERLQSYFVQRMEKVLLKHNKKMIGWDEILEGGLAPTATVMSWRGEDGGIAAANMGHDVIMTPGGWLYLDHYQSESINEPVTIGGYTTLEKTYSYEPIPSKIDKSKEHHILGTQANVWSEYIYNDSIREMRAYPRTIALAEVAWSAKENKNYEDFEKRLDNQLVRLDMHNINYHIPMPELVTNSSNFITFTDTAKLKFKTVRPIKMVYTIDGTDPTPASTPYDTTQTLYFTNNTTLKIASISVSDKLSPIRTIIIEQQAYAPAIQKPINAKAGLKAEYYKGNSRSLSDLNGITPEEIEYVATPQESKHRVKDYGEVYENDYYSTILTGYINIPENNIYYFNTDSELWIDGKKIITNESNKDIARRFSRNTKSIALAKGWHNIKIVRFGTIFGGWPTQWDDINVSIKKDGEKKFTLLDENYF